MTISVTPTSDNYDDYVIDFIINGEGYVAEVYI